MILAVRRVEDKKCRMRQLHCAPEQSDLPGQHHPGALGQPLCQVARVEKRRGDLIAPGAEGDDQYLVPRATSDRLLHPTGDLVDQRDVLTLGRSLVAGAAHTRALDIAAWVMAEQVVDGADNEQLVQWGCGFGAKDVIQPVTERDHGYSTPINRASPRCPVR